MAHLITHHDPYHIHKSLGLLVLLHYLYRFYLVFQTGTAFPPSEPTAVALCSVLLHGLLSWSSLLLPLPHRRNFSKPMIWPEFRFHSIVFASRHVLTTILSLANLWPSDDREDVLCNSLARAAIILGTVKAASLVTDRYGDRKMRTTNNMPYEKNVSTSQQLAIKRLYTSAQFGSTITSLLNDPSMNFAPLLGIQMAPLLMTLVRKNKISTGAYHRIYAVSLSLGYVVIFLRLLDVEYNGIESTFRAFVLFNIPFKRIRQFVSARTFWMVTIALATIVYPVLLGDDIVVMEKFVSVSLLKKVVWFGFIRTLVYQMITYAPLFGTTIEFDNGPCLQFPCL